MAEVAAVAAVIGAGVSVAQSRQQRKVAKEEKLQARAETIREKRRQIREARVRRAIVANTAPQIGAEGSSAASQATSSVQTQLGTNLSFLDQSFARSEKIFKAQSRISTLEGIGGAASAVGSVAGAGIFEEAFR